MKRLLVIFTSPKGRHVAKNTIRHLAFVAIVGMIGTIPNDAEAQNVFVCSLGTSGGYYPQFDTPPTKYALDVGKEIYDVLCPKKCGRVDLVQNAYVPNAMTMTTGNGYSKIAFSANFMNGVYNAFGAYAGYGVFAHEIGHHIDLNSSFPAQMSTSWSKELRADAWAGCALAKLNLPASGLLESLRVIAAYPSQTHPAWPMRWPAVEFGYKSCGGTSLVNPAPSTSTGPNTAPTSTSTKASTDPCGCEKANRKCVTRIIDLDECISSKQSACVSACQDDVDETDDCETEVCSDESPKYAGWRSSCKATIKVANTRCAEVLTTCQSTCTK